MDDRTPCPAPTGGPSTPRVLGRRAFLEDVLLLSGGAVVFLAGATAAAPAAAAEGAASAPPAAEGYQPWEHRWAYLVDPERCIGCGSCVRACSAENHVPDGFFRTWVERYVTGMDGTSVDSPNGGKDGFPALQVAFVATKSFFVPKMCNHCRETPCIQVCPVGASYRTPDGVVLVDGERCIGCAYCVQACPFGSRFLSPETHTAEKCTWCYHRITRGLRPACVEVCPTGARAFGDLRREGDPVRHAIEHDRVAVLQPHLRTEPQCFYLHLDGEVR
ncbi:4Fe-4S dicluster domain-containing protein [Anaeromyxobacter dehalogenans]|uniref:Tetrathionate reductase beta subunit n=1 Tax=Anaeromyxobacter dehalogenans (strain 2CP-C) TaxID=290397 RepID=Q2IE50_ANADE|nr:4Fe-4S dicluster domain-containing protein [Anaeromyxobacter dehalogenans]ABC82856.1 tetrathionate reductase beta subunit [Anaeromyxobacter dehalogenans 2CP-C]